jgi:hypothetical protein
LTALATLIGFAELPIKRSLSGMLKLQDPMNRQNGWYKIMRRTVKGTFDRVQDAYWERKFDSSYGEWTYNSGEVRSIDERLKDDLVLRSAEV